MNELTIFKNDRFGEIRTVSKDGEPLFVAADVCRALDIVNSRDALSRLDDDEKGVALTDTLGGKQNMIVVTESGLYSLVLGSRKPEARDFKRWITHEVIPSIRKHGAYLTPDTLREAILNPDTIIQLCQQLKSEQERGRELVFRNAQQAQRISEYEPKIQYLDRILQSRGTLTTKQIAADYDLTAQQLNKILHDEGVQYKVNDQWLLYRKHLGMGYTKSETVRITRSDGTPDSKMHTLWTQKGRLMIHQLLERRGIRAVMDKQTVREEG